MIENRKFFNCVLFRFELKNFRKSSASKVKNLKLKSPKCENKKTKIKNFLPQNYVCMLEANMQTSVFDVCVFIKYFN